MAITYEDNKVRFASVIYEDEVVKLRDFLQEADGQEVAFDFTKCDDIHLAILQLIMAYKKIYSASYEFSNTTKLFEKVLKGFSTSEDSCEK